MTRKKFFLTLSSSSLQAQVSLVSLNLFEGIFGYNFYILKLRHAKRKIKEPDINMEIITLYFHFRKKNLSFSGPQVQVSLASLNFIQGTASDKILY